MLRDLVRAGHELGNHAMYDEPSWRLSDAVLKAQIQGVEGMIRDAYAAAAGPTTASTRSEDESAASREGDGVQGSRCLGPEPDAKLNSSPGPGPRSGPAHYYFRPGSGFFSSRMQRLVKELGYRLVLGSVYPHDRRSRTGG